MGQPVTGQLGQQIWVGHVGHGSVLVTRWPMIKFTRFQEQVFCGSDDVWFWEHFHLVVLTGNCNSRESWLVSSLQSRVTRVTVSWLMSRSRGSRVKKCDPLSSLVRSSLIFSSRSLGWSSSTSLDSVADAIFCGKTEMKQLYTTRQKSRPIVRNAVIAWFNFEQQHSEYMTRKRENCKPIYFAYVIQKKT